jgi:putative MATE family efflux protein
MRAQSFLFRPPLLNRHTPFPLDIKRPHTAMHALRSTEERSMPTTTPTSTVKLAQTFYRRSGNRLLKPSLHRSMWSATDAGICNLFFPALMALVLEPIQATIETATVGHLGVAPLGAVGLGTVIFQFSLGLFGTFIFATTPAVASLAGEGNRAQASKSISQGFWVAFITGILLQAVVASLARPVIYSMSSDANVAALATDYLLARSWAIAPALIMMVAIGAARGHREMRAPLVGSLAYGVALAFFDPIFVFVLGQGVTGAGWGATFSQFIAAAAIIAVLVQRGEFDVKDMLNPPRLGGALPYFRMTPSLALNSVAALAPGLLATSLATTLGPQHLAAHTVLRQLTGFYLQAFLAFNVTAHSMIASNLGSSQRSIGMTRAAEVLERICQLAVVMSLPLGFALFATRGWLPWVFTSDSEVASEVANVLPYLLLYMPLDALGTSLEGGILGASDTRWVALRTVISSSISMAALTAAGAGREGLVVIWLCTKLLNLAALSLDLFRFLGPVVRSSRFPPASRHDD